MYRAVARSDDYTNRHSRNVTYLMHKKGISTKLVEIPLVILIDQLFELLQPVLLQAL